MPQSQKISAAKAILWRNTNSPGASVADPKHRSARVFRIDRSALAANGDSKPVFSRRSRAHGNAFFLMASICIFAACSVNVKKSDEAGRDKKVDIEKFHWRASQQMGAADVG